MSTVFYLLMILAPAALLFSAFLIVKKRAQGRPVKKALVTNLMTFAVLTVLISVLCVNVFDADDSTAADATAAQQTEATAETETSSGSSTGMGLLAAGLVTGLAGIGGGIAVAAGAPAAIAATAENPKSFGKSIIFVALGEGIALYGLLISIMIMTQL